MLESITRTKNTLQTTSKHLKTYIANRVVTVIMEGSIFHHVIINFRLHKYAGL